MLFITMRSPQGCGFDYLQENALHFAYSCTACSTASLDRMHTDEEIGSCQPQTGIRIVQTVNKQD